MHIEQLKVLLIAFGLTATIFGALVVFSDRFLAFLERTIWKQRNNNKSFTARSAYVYNRYGTGLSTLLLGVIVLIMTLTSLSL